MTLISCACGCGGERPALRSDGKPARYIRGHSNKYPPGTLVGWRQSHTLAEAKIAHIAECQFKDFGPCQGRLDTAHVDGNSWNNADNNLMKLCRAHHFLLDKGTITLENPQIPPFRVRLSGKRKGERRYLKTTRKYNVAAWAKRRQSTAPA